MASFFRLLQRTLAFGKHLCGCIYQALISPLSLLQVPTVLSPTHPHGPGPATGQWPLLAGVQLPVETSVEMSLEMLIEMSVILTVEMSVKWLIDMSVEILVMLKVKGSLEMSVEMLVE